MAMRNSPCIALNSASENFQPRLRHNNPPRIPPTMVQMDPTVPSSTPIIWRLNPLS